MWIYFPWRQLLWKCNFPIMYCLLSMYDSISYVDGILPKGPYPPCLRMADRALLAGYPRCIVCTLYIPRYITASLLSTYVYISQYHPCYIRVHFTAPSLLHTCTFHSTILATYVYISQHHPCYIRVHFTALPLLHTCTFHSTILATYVYISQHHPCYIRVHFTAPSLLHTCTFHLTILATYVYISQHHPCYIRVHFTAPSLLHTCTFHSTILVSSRGEVPLGTFLAFSIWWASDTLLNVAFWNASVHY